MPLFFGRRHRRGFFGRPRPYYPRPGFGFMVAPLWFMLGRSSVSRPQQHQRHANAHFQARPTSFWNSLGPLGKIFFGSLFIALLPTAITLLVVGVAALLGAGIFFTAFLAAVSMTPLGATALGAIAVLLLWSAYNQSHQVDQPVVVDATYNMTSHNNHATQAAPQPSAPVDDSQFNFVQGQTQPVNVSNRSAPPAENPYAHASAPPVDNGRATPYLYNRAQQNSGISMVTPELAQHVPSGEFYIEVDSQANSNNGPH